MLVVGIQAQSRDPDKGDPKSPEELRPFSASLAPETQVEPIGYEERRKRSSERISAAGEPRCGARRHQTKAQQPDVEDGSAAGK
jgi:hypothetical protein